MKQLVILAGGKGTRLQARLAGKPKSLVDVCGVPLLERQVMLAKKFNFTDVVMLVNHAAEQLIAFCDARNNWNLNLDIIDDGKPRGTAGAVLSALDRLAPEFLIMYGDTMLNVDLERFREFHEESTESAATIFLHPNDHPQDSDLVEVGVDDTVVRFHPYPHDPARWYPNLVNAALYWVRRDGIAPWRNGAGVIDFGKDLFPAMLTSGLRIRGYRSPEYIKDAGTPARLDRVCADLISGKIERASLEIAHPMIFIDRDGTINREVDHLSCAAQLELLPGVADAIKTINRSEFRCCVVTNQPVVARGDCSDEALQEIHSKLETLLGQQGAYLNRIYYCPHHPDRGFSGERLELKIDCDCRKPKIGMIERATREFNVDVSRSWLIGDSSIDMETARRAGLKSVLVESGYAGLDYRAWAAPDVVVPDLKTAVSFILDRYPRLLRQCETLARGINPRSVVLIGGQARVGKSTFAAVLRDAIQMRGLGAHVFSLDRWIISEELRTPGVMGRYDMQSVEALLKLLQSRVQSLDLALPGYHKLKRQRVESVQTVTVMPADVVIIEGTIALALNPDPALESHRINIEVDENIRRRRMLSEYLIRGFSEAQALNIYQSRLEDEIPVVAGLATGCHIVSAETLTC